MTVRARWRALRRRFPPSTWWPLALLAVVAFVPPLLTSPRRMPADSKLYLYLDPQRFLADAAGTFDPRQFAGWVPHQHISYLWPAGPWYALADWVGLPDWVAHRWWVGALCFAAGAGAWRTARTFGLAVPAALVAALAYQLSPYLLPYASRTSVMLLPWAGLPWIVWATWRAMARTGWRWPAVVGLVVLTVGSVNATALAMIVPAPLIVLVHAAAGRGRPAWTHALRTAIRIGVSCSLVSLWWIVQLVIQGRVGVDVLPYSESLADVARTSTSTEVWRQLGYWLFYIEDAGLRTTTESVRYLVSSASIAISFAVPVLGLVGLAWSRWPHRRMAWAFVAVGGITAIGVHPPDDRAPLVELVTGGGDGGLALALRSSTRAVPVLALGLALGLGALVSVLARHLAAVRTRSSTSPLPARRVLTGTAAAGLVGVLVAANLPGWWLASVVVDPAIDRDSDPPAAWIQAAAQVDASVDPAHPGRVLQLPGAEFGAFDWGYTVDQPLPGLIEPGLVTRDLLPLGSAGAMDLLWALDDRFQDGVAEPDAVAPVAELLGVDTIWLANDLAAERFDTARPAIVREVVSDASGVAPLTAFGEPFTPTPEVERIDARSVADPRLAVPSARVELARVVGADGVVRAGTDTVVVAGSGAGLVDAAAAGLLDHAPIVRYAAATDDLASAVDEAVAVVVTDTNRARARHWRSSQDTLGMTESADPELHPVERPAGDSRLPLFGDDADPGHRTTAEQIGTLRATADWYGQRFAYLPEHRPWAAIDGDLETAWLVAEHDDPLGVTFRLEVPDGMEEVRVVQAGTPDVRHLVDLVVTTADGATRPERLDARSFTDLGQPIAVAPGWNEIRIVGVEGGTPFTAGAVAPVGFREIRHDGPPTDEVVQLPRAVLDHVDEDDPVTIVLTRERVDPADIWRDDPEPSIDRAVTLPTDRTVEVTTTVRVDRRAGDVELAELFGWPAVASSRLRGMPNAAGVHAIDGEPATAWVTGFDEAVGARLALVADAPVETLTLRQPPGDYSRITEIELAADGRAVTAPVGSDDAGAATVRLDPPLPAGELTITITGIDPSTTVDRRFGDVRELPAAVAEITSPSIAVADPAPSVSTGCVDVAMVGGSTVDVRLSTEGRGWMFGEPMVTEPCTGTATLGAGDVRITSIEPSIPIEIDRLVLDDGGREAVTAAANRPAPDVEVIERTRFTRTITVDGCAAGCWLVLGEGHSTAWEASIAGTSLGEPELLDGGFTGWRLPAGPDPVVVEATWTAQRPLDIALVASALAALGLLLLTILHRGRAVTHRSPVSPSRRRQDVLGAAVWALGILGLVAIEWWPIAIAGAAAIGALGPRARTSWWAPTTVAVLGVIVVARERIEPALANAAWPGEFADLHRTGTAAFVAALVTAITTSTDGALDEAETDTVAPGD